MEKRQKRKFLLKYDDKLSFAVLLLEIFATFSHCSMFEFLEFFGKFSSDNDGILRSEIFLEITEGSEDPVDTFVDDDGIVLVLEGFKHGFATFFDRQESDKSEIVHMHPGSDESRQDGRCTGNRHDCDIFFDGTFDKDIGRIGDPRSPGIRDECHMFAFFEECDDFINLYIPRVRMERDERFGNLIVSEQNSRGTSVLTGDDIRFLKRTNRPESDIFEIPDGSGDDGEHEQLWIIKYFRDTQISEEKIDENDAGKSDGEGDVEDGVHDDGEEKSVEEGLYVRQESSSSL